METEAMAWYDAEELVGRMLSRIGEELPRALSRLLSHSSDLDSLPLHIECKLFASRSGSDNQVVASERVLLDALPVNGLVRERQRSGGSSRRSPEERDTAQVQRAPHDMARTISSGERSHSNLDPDYQSRPSKRRATGGLRIVKQPSAVQSLDGGSGPVARRLDSDNRVFPQRRKRLSDNPTMQPSTLEKFINGIWTNIFSSVKLDPTEVIEQWQAIEGSNQPKLLADLGNDLTAREGLGAFGRMSILTRKISQTSRTCRSLEVLVQANWVQCYDSRVTELSSNMSKERARKTTMDEACVDFQWTEKELRNRMCIWRGYHDIQKSGGWAALVFAGMGLYRFCKYRISFNEETYRVLKILKHRFEVAADTLHPRWRALLAIVGHSTERRYTGHQHAWVVYGPNNEAIPLSETYSRWDRHWSYTHTDHSLLDEQVWGLFDPRLVTHKAGPASQICTVCEQQQSDEPRENSCSCFPNLFGNIKAGAIPVQVFRTTDGRNNGLMACCAFERGTAIGEFVGEITSGLSNLDVMVGQIGGTTYQIFQGRQGNHTRFVNHSCQPNGQYERFVWLGMQRIILVSKGIEAGEEITCDYSDTYWRHLDKECLCGEPKCRYRNRTITMPPNPDPASQGFSR